MIARIACTKRSGAGGNKENQKTEKSKASGVKTVKENAEASVSLSVNWSYYYGGLSYRLVRTYDTGPSTVATS